MTTGDSGTTGTEAAQQLDTELRREISQLTALDPRGSFSVWVGPPEVGQSSEATSTSAGEVSLDVSRAADDGSLDVGRGARDDRAPLWTYRADVPHVAASVMKVAVAAALLRQVTQGRLTLDERVRVHPDFESAAAGQRFEVIRAEDDAPATWDHLGADVSLGWLAEQMICHSSNLATNLILERVGVAAADRITEQVARRPDRIARPIDDLPGRATGVSNTITAAGMARMFTALSAGTLTGSATTTRTLADWLAANSWDSQIPARLPRGTRVEHKNGWDDGIRHDCGLVYPTGRDGNQDPFVFCALTTSTVPDDRVCAAIATMAAISYDYWTGPRQ